MENLVLKGERVSLFIKKSDLEFVLNLLNLLQQKDMLDYNIENPSLKKDSLAFEGPPLTVEELNQIIEESEKGKKYSYEEFKSKFNL